ncbi:MAG: L-2-amino-thiazoline-4-carboxylic acid hydrolase [Christensenellales bacterium]|uniref:L-2-amino-thiazoline-4-carboxylic acid hydrolase n=1 Tax=Candidatus Avichristensenella intestinipullorum TaxID=2840693 RepID=A0A9D0YWF0_9FIRM|nr:L-2-amino-thiazoline-4-carboxylic acid hydrolase [Christensenellales bacterium]HIQ63100.1 L-2-amino-thiazoline-4-carboxylic acid hydrolase [Candidatus Avichristensenella intestinipullorum]
MNVEKALQKGRVGAAWEAIPEEAVRRAAVERFATLLAENDLSNRMLARHLTNAILPAVAVYQAATGHGWKPTEARRLIRQSVLDAAKPMAKFFQTLGKLPFFFPLFRAMCPASMKAGYGPEGWVFEWKRNDKYAIEWDCHACLYANVFRRYGVPELTAIFCESDDVMYGHIPNARWGRTKTIGRGADVCNFSFYNPRKKENANGNNQ